MKGLGTAVKDEEDFTGCKLLGKQTPKISSRKSNELLYNSVAIDLIKGNSCKH